MRLIQKRRRARQAKIMAQLKLLTGQGAEFPASDRITALEIAVERYEVISKYVQKLRQTAASIASTETALCKAQRPCAASADAFTGSELLTAQNCFRALNAALREEERSSMSWSSVLAMSHTRMARMRVWDGVFVTLSLGLMKFHGTQAEQIMGRYLPEIYETIVAATGEGEQVGVSPGAVTSQNAISRISQPKRVSREMKRLLDGECSHIEIEPVFPGPNNVPLHTYCIMWLEGNHRQQDRRERCIVFHGVTMLLPTSVDLPN